jgi:hypothetical protein
MLDAAIVDVSLSVRLEVIEKMKADISRVL